MRSNSLALFLFLLLLVAGCGGGGGGGGGGENPAPQLISITVTPANQSISVGSTLQFTATGTYSDNSTQNITTAVTWSASGTSQQIGSTGLLTATTAGTTTVTAASGTVNGSSTVSVAVSTQPQLVSITVTPTNSTVTAGTVQQFTATGIYSDNTTQNLTNTATWSATGAATEPISSTGLVNAITPGTTTVTATANGISGSTSLTVTAGANANVLTVTVDGSLCASATTQNYPNKPCVSVTVCAPGTSNCTTISDLLLDTGSIGLRVFRSALGSLPLTQSQSGSGSLAECVQFADLSSIWGPVQIADVKMGNEPTVTVPIQVIDASFGTRPSGPCQSPDLTPADAGYSGILGVGLFTEDCGGGCTGIHATNGFYYSCTASGCTGVSVALANQIQNPVAKLSADNNGVLVSLPAVPLGGAQSVNGSLILGIGTRSNNTPGNVTTFPANSSGEFRTVFRTTTFTNSFIDTGSNGLFFADSTTSGLPLCTDPSWYCPPTTTPLTATTVGAFGSPSKSISFNIGNFNALDQTSNRVFQEIGGPAPATFDWGLPFFLGRNVFVGLQGVSSPLGVGPFWAY